MNDIMTALITTNKLVDSLAKRVGYYNSMHKDRYVIPYQNFIRFRQAYLEEVHTNSIGGMISDRGFVDRLYQMLKDFGLDARRSKLVNPTQIQNSLGNIKSTIKKIHDAGIELTSLNLFQELEGRSLAVWFNSAFSLLSKPNAITDSGGVVAASKTLHFLLPDIFIMIDGAHIVKALSRIKDYFPDPTDGESWYDVIPEHELGIQLGYGLNPKSRGAWDDPIRYLAAHMYYKRISLTWCNRFKKTLEEFLQLDADHQVTASRIIDKALWW